MVNEQFHRESPATKREKKLFIMALSAGKERRLTDCGSINDLASAASGMASCTTGAPVTVHTIATKTRKSAADLAFGILKKLN